MSLFGKIGTDHLFKRMTIFSNEELNRYHRQLILPEIGEKGQTMLKNARVLMVGAGGLGCPILQYLCAAGVGTLGIVDFDRVEIHNLQRQIIYTTTDVGKSKAETSATKLKAQNPNVEIVIFNEMLTTKNSTKIISEFDVIIDGSDNFPTRYLINDTCVELNKPLIYGSIFNFEGQMAVFNYNSSKNLRDIFPEPPNPEETPGCNENGVLGVVPGILGVYMANACIQVILKSYGNHGLMIFDFNQFSMMKIGF